MFVYKKSKKKSHAPFGFDVPDQRTNGWNIARKARQTTRKIIRKLGTISETNCKNKKKTNVKNNLPPPRRYRWAMERTFKMPKAARQTACSQHVAGSYVKTMFDRQVLSATSDKMQITGTTGPP